jgi:hypothetical protein
MKMNKQINNIKGLERRVSELRKKQLELETRLDNNFSSLKDNYVGMAFNSIFGSKKKTTTHFWADIVTRIMESEKLQTGVSKLAETLADKLGDGIHNVFSKE